MSGAEVRAEFVAGIRDNARRDRIIADEDNIVVEEAAFRSHALWGTAGSLTPKSFSKTIHEDMEWLYNQRLVKSVKGRSIWERILKLGGEKCPLCHIAKSRTLDHSIPKAVHPRLSVEPMNLVPACRDCNLERNVGRGNMSLSPYFDRWAADLRWLVATVPNPQHPEDLIFAPERHGDLSDQRWESLTAFFEDTDLGSRYTNLAVDEFFPLRAALRSSFGGPPPIDDVEAVLSERHIAWRDQLGHNRWQTAAYEAWFQTARVIPW
ncbi:MULTISPECIES: HNH endonuclease [unclassified Arthrobacter]|uniref:HNH endonuclease n=1 Tax=unclassified Arthrobacter TaxID=235627 RepID=UPI0011B0D43B|nr:MULTISPECIES: HNH endonuclease signature motif containing protein [unclassified Arthrobacter]